MLGILEKPENRMEILETVDVVAPGSKGTGMVEGVTSAQFATFNEFPLSEQSRSWAAFSERPLL